MTNLMLLVAVSAAITLGIKHIELLEENKQLKQHSTINPENPPAIEEFDNRLTIDECNQRLHEQIAFVKVDGCYEGIAKLCERTDKYLTCKEELSDVCRELGD